MARPEELIPGNCYFLVGFHDRDLLFPYISTLTYVEREEDKQSGYSWLFREPREDLSPDAKGDERSELIALKDDQLHQIVDLRGLVKWLDSVAPDHPITAPATRSTGSATSADLQHLRSEIAKVLEYEEYLSVTVTILFTDDGFSVGRRDGGGVEMNFFPHPRTEAHHEAGIRELFDEMGVAPHEDYLADRGRTRILAFGVPEDLDAIMKICERLFLSVYVMRADDILRYKFLRRHEIGPHER